MGSLIVSMTIVRACSGPCRFGAFAEDTDLFDAAHFRLSRAEATSIDPQTRLLLQVGVSGCWRTAWQ